MQELFAYFDLKCFSALMLLTLTCDRLKHVAKLYIIGS